MSFDFNIPIMEWALAESIVKYFDVLVPLNINNHGLKYVCRLARSALFTWIYYLVGLNIEAQAKMNVKFFFSIFLEKDISFDIKSLTNKVFFFSKINCDENIIFDKHWFVYNFMDPIERLKQSRFRYQVTK